MVPEEMKYLNFKFEVNLYLWGEKDIKYCSLFYFPTHMDSAKDKSQGNVYLKRQQ